MCEQLFSENATRTALTSSTESAKVINIATKTVQRGTNTVLSEGTVQSPFNATLGKWAAGGGAIGGLLTFMGIASIDNARDALTTQYAINNPGIAGQQGQVPGRIYEVQFSITWVNDYGYSGSNSGSLGNFTGPLNVTVNPSYNQVYLRINNSPHILASTYNAIINPNVQWKAIPTNGTTEEQDKKDDPNATSPPTSWNNATPQQQQEIVNNATPDTLKNLYSVAPVVGVPSPSGTQDVYYKPQGSEEWVKLDNPTTQTINNDTNGDGVPDLNIDTNGDGVPDLNIDTNGDGVPDTNVDTNGDGVPDTNIDTNGDGVPDTNVDTNNDGQPDAYQPPNGSLDAKTFNGTFFISYAAEKLSHKFPFDIIGNPGGGTASSECPNYTFFDEVIELCILKDAFTIILIPFKIGLAAIFYQKI